MTRKSFQQVNDRRAVQVLDLIYYDVCGPMNSMTPDQKKTFPNIYRRLFNAYNGISR